LEGSMKRSCADRLHLRIRTVIRHPSTVITPREE
jgi:hypothetical protein